MSTSLTTALLVVGYFLLCQYFIQKNPGKLFFLCYLEAQSVIKAFLIGILLIAAAVALSTVLSILTFIPIMVTIFFGSYLTERLKRRMEERV